jgi:hypothetical protein
MTTNLISIRIPLRTGRGPNEREHHMARASRVKRERWATGLMLNLQRERPQLPCVVMLVRHGPAKRLLDDDNLRGALKAVRDEVARWLGVDDADARVRWAYAQARDKQWGVAILANADDADDAAVRDEQTQGELHA